MDGSNRLGHVGVHLLGLRSACRRMLANFSGRVPEGMAARALTPRRTGTSAEHWVGGLAGHATYAIAIVARDDEVYYRDRGHDNRAL